MEVANMELNIYMEIKFGMRMKILIFLVHYKHTKR